MTTSDDAHEIEEIVATRRRLSEKVVTEQREIERLEALLMQHAKKLSNLNEAVSKMNDAAACLGGVFSQDESQDDAQVQDMQSDNQHDNVDSADGDAARGGDSSTPITPSTAAAAAAADNPDNQDDESMASSDQVQNQPTQTSLHIGQAVMVKYRNINGKEYPAKIVKIKELKSGEIVYNIQYDDTDREYSVKVKRITAI